jgi:Uma2 family endonuclease
MATTSQLTLAQFLPLPETEPASEYADGEVVRRTMPSVAHMIDRQLLSIVAGLFVQRNGLGLSGPEGRCIFGPAGAERALVPDYLILSASHTSGLDLHGPIRRAPDLAVETLSPDDRMTQVMEKLRFYLANGVRVVWLIDPERRTLTVLTPPETTRILTEEDTVLGGGVLAGFTCTMRDLLPPTETEQPGNAE